MMLGLPGSGKTTFSKRLQFELDIPRLSIDEEYSKLGGKLHDSSWDKDLSALAGSNIREQTKRLVTNGDSVILDLCPWIKVKRDEYRLFVESIGANCHIYYFDIEKEELLRRLTDRNQSGEDHYIVQPKALDEFFQEFDEPINEDVEILRY